MKKLKRCSSATMDISGLKLNDIDLTQNIKSKRLCKYLRNYSLINKEQPSRNSNVVTPTEINKNITIKNVI